MSELALASALATGEAGNSVSLHDAQAAAAVARKLPFEVRSRRASGTFDDDIIPLDLSFSSVEAGLTPFESTCDPLITAPRLVQGTADINGVPSVCGLEVDGLASRPPFLLDTKSLEVPAVVTVPRALSPAISVAVVAAATPIPAARCLAEADPGETCTIEIAGRICFLNITKTNVLLKNTTRNVVTQSFQLADLMRVSGTSTDYSLTFDGLKPPSHEPPDHVFESPSPISSDAPCQARHVLIFSIRGDDPTDLATDQQLLQQLTLLAQLNARCFKSPLPTLSCLRHLTACQAWLSNALVLASFALPVCTALHPLRYQYLLKYQYLVLSNCFHNLCASRYSQLCSLLITDSRLHSPAAATVAC